MLAWNMTLLIGCGGAMLRDGGGSAASSRSSLDDSNRGACQMSLPGGLPRWAAGRTFSSCFAAWAGACDTHHTHTVSYRCSSVSCPS